MKKIYIAGSLFTEGEQERRIKEEEEIFERFDGAFEVYNPITADFNQNKESLPTPVDIYNGDFEQVYESNVLLVDLGCVYDPGVMLEVGMAAGMNELWQERGEEWNKITLIGVLSDIRYKSANKYEIPTIGINHMLLGSFEKHGHIVSTFEEALNLLEELV